MLYDRSVNSSSSFPALLKVTSSPSFVCSFSPRHFKSTHNLVFNADSGHSDQQLSFDDIEEEEDGQDEGMPSLILHSDSSDLGFTVIITCDLRRIIDNVKTISLPARSAPSLTFFIGAQVYSRQGPPCWLLPLRKSLVLVLPFLYIHSLSLRLSWIHVTVAPCSICPITTATIYMCRGYQRAIAVQKLCKTRSVYVPPFPSYQSDSDDNSKCAVMRLASSVVPAQDLSHQVRSSA